MAVHKSQWHLAKIHSWGWRKFWHNLHMLLICQWFILSLSRCCDFDSSCCFLSAPLLFWLCSSRVFACSLQLHSQFCCSSLCPARGWMSSSASFTCLGAKARKWKVQRGARDEGEGCSEWERTKQRSWSVRSQTNDGSTGLKVSPVLPGLMRRESHHTSC